jgi:hypothetical protein
MNDALTGKSYSFEDGGKIEVIQVKQRDDGPWVTYQISVNDSLPRKLTMHRKEFMDHYKHLFGPDDA